MGIAPNQLEQILNPSWKHRTIELPSGETVTVPEDKAILRAKIETERRNVARLQAQIGRHQERVDAYAGLLREISGEGVDQSE